MRIKHIITSEDFYIIDGEKIHFYYVEEEHGHYLYIEGNIRVSEFYIPNTINGKPVAGLDGDIFEGMINISSFKVEDDNEYFKVYEEGLYSKDMKYMYYIAPKYQHNQLCIPDGVKYILEDAVHGNDIEEIILPESCEIIYEYAFSVLKKLKTIYLPKKIKHIASTSILLFSTLFFPYKLSDIYYQYQIAVKVKTGSEK